MEDIFFTDSGTNPTLRVFLVCRVYIMYCLIVLIGTCVFGKKHVERDVTVMQMHLGFNRDADTRPKFGKLRTE